MNKSYAPGASIALSLPFAVVTKTRRDTSRNTPGTFNDLSIRFMNKKYTFSPLRYALGMLLLCLVTLGASDATAQTTATYSYAFTNGQAPSAAACNAWDTYRASLSTSYCYSSFRVYGSNDATGKTCSNPAIAQAVATALHNGTALAATYDATSGQTWVVQIGCVTSVCTGNPQVELTGTGSGCNCLVGYTVRPNFNNLNWGGITTNSCSPASQTISVDFTYSLPPSVTISLSTTSNVICPGTSETFTATPSNAGTGQTYQWYNGASPIVGQTGITYASSTLNTGDTISVKMTSTGGLCGTVVVASNKFGMTVAGPPTITSVSPLHGYVASSVTISGTNFNTTAASNIVFFGATMATVNTASATSLSVTVPTDANYQNVTVLNSGCALTAFSQYPYLPTYNNSAYATGVDFSPFVYFTTGSYPQGIALGDLDGDGKTDIALTNTNSNTVSVYRNTSTTGTLNGSSFAAKQDFATGSYPYAVAIGDLDGDGKPEMVITNYLDSTVSILRNTATSGSITSSSFATKVDFRTGKLPSSVQISDLDGDGKADIAVANFTSNSISVFRNTSSVGSITGSSLASKVDFTTGSGPNSIAIGDLDGDGKPDMAVANYSANTFSAIRNTSSVGTINSSSFAAKVDFTTGSDPSSLAIADLDGDGKQDIAVVNSVGNNTVSVFRNTTSVGSISSSSFASKVDFATGQEPLSIAIGDIDGDGKPDMLIANASSGTFSVLRNTASPGSISSSSFAGKVDFNTGSGAVAIVTGDLNGDGKPDVATIVAGNTLAVFQNTPDVAPTFTNSSPYTISAGICENASATDITSYLTVVDPDASQTETWSPATGGAPKHGGTLTFTGATASTAGNNTPIQAPANSITYTPSGSYTGSDTFTVQVSDGIATANIQMAVNITASPLPSVTIASNRGFSITAGVPDTFTVTPVNGGPTPTYQWYKNSSSVATGSTYITSSLSNNDSITCVLTSNATCAIPSTATAYIRMTVNALPVVSIPATGCLPDTITLTSSLNPLQIQWKQNGSVVQTTNAGWSATATTVAGGNGFGSAANQLADPENLYVDAAGDVYVADNLNERIQKWAPGAITGVTVAGGNSNGSAANQFNSPTDVYLDGNGNIYIADNINSRVQKWAPGATSGTTVVSSSQLASAISIYVDGSGNIYVVDFNDGHVKKFAPGATSGTIVAGGGGIGSAANQLDQPTGIYLDGSGNLYVVDELNSRVQKWTPGATSGITVAGGNGSGSAANQFANPFGIYIDGSGNIYVADQNNNRIQKWAPGATSGTTVAGGNGPGSAANQLFHPSGVYIDGGGNMYVADYGNNRVQKFTPNINTYIATSSASYSATVTTFGGAIATTGADVVGASVTPSLTISSSAGFSITAGISDTFTATPTNGGTTPTYQWYKNTTAIATGSTYITSSLSNNDSIACVMTSNATCASPTTASAYIRMTVNALPVVSIPSTGCLPDTITLTSSLNPLQIQWKQGSSVVQTTNASWAANATTVAGQSSATSGSDASHLNLPWGVYLDAGGNIYVADQSNNRVQKWTPGATSGVTVAGTGTTSGSDASHLSNPKGVCVDGSGNIYVADVSNNRIQKWEAGATSGTTVAGTGTTSGTDSSHLNGPVGVFVDASGNIFVADASNNRVQKWVPGATSGTTVAGTGITSGNDASHFNQPVGVYGDGSGNIYVMDQNNHRVQKWAPGATSGTTVAGTGATSGSDASHLNNPAGVFVDGSGNIYVSDLSNQRIQKWAPGATSGTTVAGNGTSGTGTNQFYYPIGVYVDGSGNIYVADNNNNRVQKFAPNTDFTYTASGSGTYTATATTFGGASATTSADVVGSSVTPSLTISSSRGFSINASSPDTFTATPTNGGTTPTYQWYKNTTAIATGSTYITSSLSNNDSITCVMTSNATCASPTTASAYIRMTVNALPVVSIPSTGCTPDTITLSSSLNPSQIVWKQGGSTVQTTNASWVANGTTVAGTGTTNAADASHLGTPTGIYVDGSGNTYVADYNNNRIQKWAPGATSGTTVAGTGTAVGSDASHLSAPTGVYVDGSGNIFVADYANSRIQKWAPGATSGTTVAGTVLTYGTDASHLGYPLGVYVDGSGNIYVADYLNHRIQKWAPGATSGTTVAGQSNCASGSDASHLNKPAGVYVDGSGNIYVADQYNHRIQKWAPGATSGTTVAGIGTTLGTDASHFQFPYDVYVDGIGNIYVADEGNNRIQKWAAGATSGTTVAGTGTASGTDASHLNGPTSVVVDGSGNIFVADQVNNRVQKFTANTNITYIVPGSGTYTAVATTFGGAGATTGTDVVGASVTPSLTIASSRGFSISASSPDTFTATPTNGGASPTYQWYKNTTAIATGSTYITSSLSNNDSITCVMTSNATCASPATATSGYIRITVNALPIVSIPASGCTPDTIALTSSLAPLQIQWKQGSSVVQTINASWNANATTVAGGNGAGSGASQFNNPGGVYVDASGNVYVGDQSNSRVQKWAPGATSGTTVAGGNGAGSAANQFNFVRNVYVDGTGNVYVADIGNARIQKWAPGATSGTTVAGGNGAGSAANQLNAPTGFYVDGSGNIYVADQSNNRVQKWAPGATSGITVAGQSDGTSGTDASHLNQAYGVTVDGGGNVYVADLYNHRVQKWATGVTSGITVAGGNGLGIASNQLNYPVNVYLDGSGNIYVSDLNNYRIQEWAPGATSGTTVAGVNGRPTAIYIDGSGNLYVADQSNNLIQKFAVNATTTYIVPSSGSYTAVATTFGGASATTGADVVGSSVTPSLTISSSRGFSINASSPDTFTATPTNGGTTPTYQWYKNTTAIATGSTYITSSLSNNDSITCVMTSNAACASPTTATSGYIRMTVNALPVVSIPATGCTPDTITLSCSLNPLQIQWKQGGSVVQTTNASWAANATTVAGQSSGAYGTDASHLSVAASSYVDGSGNIYVADALNNRVQKWAPGATSGTTIAGTGIASGTDASHLKNPFSVFVDGSGNIYVSDQGNNRVQKWVPGATSGTTVAGQSNGISGIGANQLNSPNGVYADGSGNIYVADQFNNRVQKWALGATSGTTVAGQSNGTTGTDASHLNSPTVVYVDGSGNIYVAEASNNRVQKWAHGATSGTTVAGQSNGTSGSGTNQLNVATGVYVDGSSNVYVVDYLNNRIQQWAPGATSGTTVAGQSNGTSGTDASHLNGPNGVCLDGNGNIYVADYYNHRVQKFTPNTNTYIATSSGSYSATATTFGGASATTSADVVGASVTPSLTIASSRGFSISASSSDTFTATPTNGGASPTYQWYKNTTAIATGNPFITSSLSNNDSITCVMTSNAACASPTTAISNYIRMTVNALPVVSIPATGCTPDTITLTSSLAPLQIQWKQNGSLVQTTNASWAANATTVAGTGITSGSDASHLNNPYGVYVDGSGNVYVADELNQRVQKWAPGATSGTTVAGTGITVGTDASHLNSPTGIYVDGSGNIYVADGSNNRVQKWAPGATSGTTVAGQSNGVSGTDASHLQTPSSVYVDGSGNVYVADANNSRVQKWAPGATSGTTVAGNGTQGTGLDQLSGPVGIFVDALGNIYVAELFNNRIQKWAPGATSGTTVAGTGTTLGTDASHLNFPNGVFVDGSGNIYVSDYQNNRIQKWASGATSGTTVAGTGTTIGTDASHLYFPGGVYVDGSGNIYVADQVNNRVQKFAPNTTTSYIATSAASYTAVVTTFGGASATTSADVVGGPCNTAPVFSNGTSFTIPTGICQNANATDITGSLKVVDPDNSQTETWSQASGGAPKHGGTLTFTTSAHAGTAGNSTPIQAPTSSITYTPSGSYTGSDTFTVQVSDGIATANIQVTVTINPTPSLTTATTASTCSGFGPNISLTASAASTFAWTIGTITGNITGASAGSGSTINQALSNPSNSNNGSIIYAVTPTSTLGSCAGSATNITVTVYPTPSVATANTASTCSGFGPNISLTASAASTFAWALGVNTGGITGASAGSGSTINQTLTNPSNSSAGSIVYAITPTSTLGSCVGSPANITVTVNPIPSLTTSSTALICSGFSPNISLTASAASNFAWTLGTNTGAITGASASSGSAINQTLTNPSNSTAGSIVYAVTPTSTIGSCVGSPTNITVTVNPTPSVITSNTAIVCSGNTTNISLTASAVSSFAWTLGTNTGGLTGASASSGSSIAQTLINLSSNNSGSIVYVVTPTSTVGSCVGSPYNITVTVSPQSSVALSLTPGVIVCAGTNITFTATPSNGGTSPTYQWYKNGIAISGATNTTYSSSTMVSGDVFTVGMTSSNTCGPTTVGSNSATMTINPIPVFGSVSPQTVCNNTANAAVVFSGTPNAVYNWANNLTSIGLGSAGSGTSVGSFTASNSSNIPVTALITVTPTYSFGGVTCTGSSSTYNITVNPTPSVSAVSNQTVCHGTATTAVTFTGSAVAGTTYNWTNNNTTLGLSAASGTGSIGSFTGSNTGSGPASATITITPTANNCNGATQGYTYTVNPIPNVSSMSNQVNCPGASVAAVVPTGSAVTGTVYNWTSSNSAIGLAAASGTGTIASFNATNSGVTQISSTINVTPTFTNNSVTCTGTPQSYTSSVNPTPTVVAVSNQTLCNGTGTSAITFTGTVPATVFTWSNNTSIGIAGSGTGSIGAFSTTIGSNAPVTDNFTVTPTVTISGVTCTGSNGTFNITVNPIPTVNSFTNQVTCNTAVAAAVVPGGSLVSGTVYNWTNSNTAIGLAAASGTGTIASFTATNSGTTQISSTINVTPTFTNNSVTCTGTSQSYTSSVNPTPNVAAVSNQTLCNGTGTSAITFTGTVPATVFTWSNNTSIGIAGSGTGSIGAFNTTISSNAPVTDNFTVTPTVTISGVTCTGSNGTFNITVNPIPTVNSFTNQVTCNGAAATAVVPTGNVSGTVYNWANTNTAIGLAGSGTGTIGSFTATNSGNTQISGTINVTPTFTNNSVTCTGTAQSYTSSVNPTPNVATVSNQTLCNNFPTTAIAFSGNVANTLFSWTSSPAIGAATSGTGSIASFTAVNNTNAAVTSNYTVTPSLTLSSVTCTGSNGTFSITVNPTLPVSVSISSSGPLNNIICTGTAVTFTAHPVNGGTSPAYQWYKNNQLISGATSATYATSTLNNNDFISCTMTNNAICPSAATSQSNSITFTVNPVPVVTAVSNVNVCNNTSSTTITFTGGPGPAANVYTWTSSNTAIGLAAASGTGNIPTFLATDAGSSPISSTITVTPAATTLGLTCSGSPQTFTITVNPTPSVSAVSSQTICSGTATNAVTFTGSPVSGTTYNWNNSNTGLGLSAASGTGSIGSFTGSNNGSGPASASIIITPSANNCNGATQSFTYTVNPVPNVNSFTNQLNCPAANVSAVVPSGNVTGAVYTWTSSSNAIGLAAASGTGTIPSFVSANTGNTQIFSTITVTPTFTNNSVTCTGTAQSYTSTVNPMPNVATLNNQTLCNGSSTNAILFTGNVANTIFSWSNNAAIGLAATGTGNIAAFNTTIGSNAPVTSAFTVTPSVTISGLTCTGSNGTFNITVNPIPTVNGFSNQLNCSGANVSTVVPGGNVTGTVYTWTNSNTSIGLAQSGTGNIPSFAAANSGSTQIAGTISVTPTFTNNSVTCTGSSQSYTSSVNPVPNVAAVNNQTVCNGTSTSAVLFTGNVANTVFNWSNNTAIGLAASGSGSIAAFNATTGGSFTPLTSAFTVTPSVTISGLTCTGTNGTFSITVNPIPNISAISNQAFCNGVTVPAVVPTGNVTGTVYTWTSSSTAIGIAASGTGTIASFTATNAGTGKIFSTISIIPTFSNNSVTCTGTALSYADTVNPVPAVSSVLSQTLCNGAATNPIIFSGSSVAATAYNWTNSLPSIGLAASGTGSIASFNAVNNTNNAVTANISVTPAANGCNGAPQNFSISVNPTLPVSVSIAASTINVICAGTSVTHTATAVNGGSAPLYQWYVDNVAVGPNSAVNTFTTSSLNNNDFVSCKLTGNAGCASATVATSNSITYTVNPIPVLANVSNIALCNNAVSNSIIFSGGAPGTTYSWTSSNTAIGLALTSGTGSIASFTATNTGTAPISATITGTPSYTNQGVTCTGSAQTFSITVNPTPSVNAVSSQTICAGTGTNAVSFSGSAVAGTTYNWTNNTTSIGLAASGTGSIAAFTAINTGNGPVTANIAVTPIANGCTGTAQNFNITVNPMPTAGAIASQLVCNGANTTGINISGSVSNTSFSWVNNTPSIGLAASGNGNIGSFTAANSGTSPLVAGITVTPSANSCTGATQYFTITVNPTPVMSSVSNQAICNAANTTATNFSSNVYGTTYSWSNNNTSIGLAANGNGNIAAFTGTNTGNTPAIASVTVIPSANSCNGSSQSFSITVNPSPSVTAPLNQVVCNAASSTAITFGGSQVANTVYNWSTLNTSIGIAAGGQGGIGVFTASNTTSSPVVATVYIIPTANGCNGPSQSFTYTVNPTPVAYQVSNMVVCNNATAPAASFSGNVSGTAYSWTNSATSIGLGASGTGNIPTFTASNSGTAAVTANISVIPTANNCSGSAMSFNITVNPSASLNQPASQLVCGGSAAAIPAFTSTASGTSYSWTNSNTSIGLGTSGSGNIASFMAINATTSPVLSTITVTPSVNGCSGPDKSFTITVNPGASLTSSSIAPSLCSGNTLTYNATSNISAASLSWTRPAVTGITPATSSGTGGISEVLNNTTPNLIVVTYNYTLSYNGCTTAQNVTDTVRPTPYLSSTLTPSPVCDNSVFTYTPTSATPGLTFSWSRPSVPGLSNVAATGTGTINEVLADTSSVSVNVPYTYSLSYNGCTGTNTVTVAVYKAPLITTQASAAVTCAGGSASYSITAGGTADNYQWQLNTGSGFTNLSINTTYSGVYTPTLTLSNVQPGMNGYQYRCLVSNICTAVANSTPATLTVDSLPAVLTSPSNSTICDGSNTTFTATGSGTGISYQWWVNTGTVFVPVVNGGVYSGALTNTLSVTHAAAAMNGYQYHCVITGACAPAAISANAILSVHPNPQPPLNNNTSLAFCSGDSVGLSTSTGPNYSYQWQLSNTSISNATASSYQAHNAGSYTVTVTNNFGCTNTSAPVTVTVTPSPSAPVNVLFGTVIFCAGDSVILGTNTAPGLSYQWLSNSVAIPGDTFATATIYTLGFYSVAVTQNGCTVVSPTQTILTNALPSDSLVAIGNPVICSGNSYVLSALSLPGQSYQWYDNGALIPGAIAAQYAATSAGTYNVHITNVSGCNMFTNSVYVSYVVSPTPSITGIGTAISTANNYNTYQWYLNGNSIAGANLPAYTATLNGSYTVTVTDTNGCSGTSAAYPVNSLGITKVQISGTDIKIYPNPATAVIHIDAPARVNVNILSLEGKVVIHQDNAQTIDISQIPNGPYMIQVFDNDNNLIKTDRMVKNNW